MDDSLPAGLRFDAVKLIQEFVGGEQGGDPSGTVQEGRLIRYAVRLRLNQGGNRFHLNAGRGIHFVHRLFDQRPGVAQVGTQCDEHLVASAFAAYRNGAEGQTHRCPGFADFNPHAADAFVHLQHGFGNVLGAGFNQVKSILGHDLLNPLGDFRVVDRILDAVGKTGRPDVHIHLAGHEELLSQHVLLREHPVICENFQSFNSNSILSVHFILPR